MKRKYIIEAPTSGEAKIDIEALIRSWKDPRFCLSQWKDEFRLIERTGKKVYANLNISPEVARSLIDRLLLIETKSSVFTSGSTWRQSYGER